MPDTRDLFANPPKSHRIMPFWFLNRDFDEPELRRQIAEMDEKGVGGVVLHCRHGLLVEYMSDEWLDMIGVCIDELKKRGMEAWLYDEDDWPSGTVGGKLTRPHPEFRMRYLRVQQILVSGGVTYQTTLEADDNKLLGIQAWKMDDDGQVVLPASTDGSTPPCRDITEAYSDGKLQWQAPPGKWLVVPLWECPVAERVTWDRAYYLDTMNPEAVNTFKQMAYEPYLRFREDFGKTVKGIFTDEPGLMIHDGFFGTAAMRTCVDDPQRTLPGVILAWTRDFYERFEALKGYDLRPWLLALLRDVGPETHQIRCDYYDALTTWYIEAYHGNLSAWAAGNGLDYIGHTLEDPLWGAVRSQGNQIRVLESFHRPGLDYLGHGVGTRENPFRILASKCGSSVAHIQGKPRVMCESFGGSGHGHTLAARRLDANFMACLGVNMFIPHAFYYSFQGFRKTDWPPTEFYHSPFWPWYRHWADYLARLSVLESAGRHVSDALVLQPIRTVQVDMFQNGETVREPEAQKLFNRVSDLLLRLHHDYDFADESQLLRAQVQDGRLAFAESEETYPLLVLPGCRVISLETARFLKRFFDGGGHILALGELPSECAERESAEELAELLAHVFGPERNGEDHRNENEAGGVALSHAHVGEDLPLWLLQNIPHLVSPDVMLDDDERRPVEDLICCHRAEKLSREEGAPERHYFLLVNRSAESQKGMLRISAQGLLQEWHLETGKTANLFGAQHEEGRLCCPVELEPSEARLVVVTEGEELPSESVAAPDREVVEKVPLEAHWDFSPQDPNVLILDRWTYVARDRQAGVRHHVGIPGQVNSYRTTFEVAEKPRQLRLVLDDVQQSIPSHVGFLSRRRNVEIYVNGEQAGPLVPSTWQDRYFLETDLTNLVETGINTLEIHVLSLLEPFEHLNEPAYLIGDFAVLEDRLCAPQRQVHGPFNEQGYPHFAGIAAHTQRVEIPAEYCTGHRVILDPGEVHDCCRIVVNGEEVAVRLWPPFQVDITSAVKPGRNEITVEVANSLVNLYEKESRTSGLIGPARLWVLK